MQRLAQALLLLLAVTACGQRTDPQTIEGHWVAENLRIQSIQLPIGPDLFISKNSLGLGSGLEAVQLSGIEADCSEVTLKTKFGFDVVFHFENKNKMYFTVPFIGDRIYYNRADDTKTATAALHPPTPAATEKTSLSLSSSSEPPAAVAERAPSEGSLHGSVAALSVPTPRLQQQPSAETHYQQALASLRQGDADTSLRSLSAALASGFVDWQRIEREQLFSQLQDDMRFQVLQARWKKE